MEPIDIDEVFDVEEQLKKKRPKLRIFRFFFVLLILAGLVALVSVPNVSRVRHVLIKGNKYVSDDEIIKALELYDYPNFYFYFPSLFDKNLIQDERINAVTVKKKFGFVVEVEVDEAQPIMYDYNNKEFLYSNMVRIPSNRSDNYPLLINDVEDEYLLKLLEEFMVLPSEVYQLISEVEYAPTAIDVQRFRLYMSDQNTVYVTLPTLSIRLKYYNDVTKEIGDEKGILFLDVGAVTSQRVQVVFRKYEEAN